MGGMPDAGSSRSALLSSMLPDEDDPPCYMGWGVVAVPPLVVCCSSGWLSQGGTEAGAPNRVPPIPVPRKGGSQFGVVAICQLDPVANCGH